MTKTSKKVSEDIVENAVACPDVVPPNNGNIYSYFQHNNVVEHVFHCLFFYVRGRHMCTKKYMTCDPKFEHIPNFQA